jgi:hypothetical protein
MAIKFINQEKKGNYYEFKVKWSGTNFNLTHQIKTPANLNKDSIVNYIENHLHNTNLTPLNLFSNNKEYSKTTSESSSITLTEMQLKEQEINTFKSTKDLFSNKTKFITEINSGVIDNIPTSDATLIGLNKIYTEDYANQVSFRFHIEDFKHEIAKLELEVLKGIRGKDVTIHMTDYISKLSDVDTAYDNYISSNGKVKLIFKGIDY